MDCSTLLRLACVPQQKQKKLLLSIYRRLYKELHALDNQILAKTLFPLPKDLQMVLNIGALYVPNNKKYTDQLRSLFYDTSREPHLKLAFDTLHRIRAHQNNLRDRLPGLQRQCRHLNHVLEKCYAQQNRPKPFLATRIETPPSLSVSHGGDGSTAVPILEAFTASPITPGTLLLAHPLSSAHVDRRVMMITERTPLNTSAVVLDLRFTFPLSRGNPMFPEVFYGHDVYDGGFSQIGFTMPPTAQISIIHTLEPPKKQHTPSKSNKWFRWASNRSGGSTTMTPGGEDHLQETEGDKIHQALCTPLIKRTNANEPTVYFSRVEALPYLGTLALGARRETVRIFWGSMRWPSTQLDAEVRSGHWIPVSLSPSFFFHSKKKVHRERFPTREALENRRVTPQQGQKIGDFCGMALPPSPQSFPPEKTLRQREPLWDEILYALGGEYRQLVGCNNPFSGNTRWAVPHILSPDYALELVTNETEPMPKGESNDGVS